MEKPWNVKSEDLGSKPEILSAVGHPLTQQSPNAHSLILKMHLLEVLGGLNDSVYMKAHPVKLNIIIMTGMAIKVTGHACFTRSYNI